MRKNSTNCPCKVCVLFLPISTIICVMAILFSFFVIKPNLALAADEPINQSDGSLHKVMVGGQSVGIILQTKGAAVLGFAPVLNKEGKTCFPGRDSGLEVGDFITMVNDSKVSTDDEISTIINQLGAKEEEIILTVIRDNQPNKIKVKPAFCTDTETWRIGLYIRDNTAGIGTLTFYDPQSKTYGALGHLVADLDDKMVADEKKGEILSSSIQDIKPGKKGEPGEKIGVFGGNKINGSILKNSDFGIFGFLATNLDNALYPQPLDIAKVDQVKVGPAKIVTVVSGDKMEEFDIEIVKLMPSHKATGKGMVIKITDKKLLDLTGGIVQGMSGSPIIQDGKLVGAVTHVFVNDPTSGYGCFAEWMLNEVDF